MTAALVQCPKLCQLLLVLFLTFSVLVVNPKKLLYTVANPARGLLNREKRTKEKASIFHELLKFNLRLFLGVIDFQQFVEEKPPDNVQFQQQLLKSSGYTAVTVLKTVL